MTLGSGPFRSREEAKQPSDWQKYANRVALKYSCWRTLPDAHIRGWDSALDRGRVLHMCRVDYCWERGRDPPSPAKAGLKGVHRQDCRRPRPTIHLFMGLYAQTLEKFRQAVCHNISGSNR